MSATTLMEYVPIYKAAVKPRDPNIAGGSFYTPRQKMYVILKKPFSHNQARGGNFWDMYGPENNPRAILKQIKMILNHPGVPTTFLIQENMGMEPIVLMELIPIDTEIRMV